MAIRINKEKSKKPYTFMTKIYDKPGRYVKWVNKILPVKAWKTKAGMKCYDRKVIMIAGCTGLKLAKKLS